MYDSLVYHGYAFLSFNDMGRRSEVLFTRVTILEVTPGLYELRSSSQQDAYQVLVTTTDRLCMQGAVVMQIPGVTYFVPRFTPLLELGRSVVA